MKKIAFVAFSVLLIFVSSLCLTSFKAELGCAKSPNEISCVNVKDPGSKWLLGVKILRTSGTTLIWDPLGTP